MSADLYAEFKALGVRLFDAGMRGELRTEAQLEAARDAWADLARRAHEAVRDGAPYHVASIGAEGGRWVEHYAGELRRLHARRAALLERLPVVHSWPCSPVVGFCRAVYGLAYGALGHGAGWYARTWASGARDLVAAGLRVGLAPDLLRVTLEAEAAAGGTLTGAGLVFALVEAHEWRDCAPAWDLHAVKPCALPDGVRLSVPVALGLACLHAAQLDRREPRRAHPYFVPEAGAGLVVRAVPA